MLTSTYNDETEVRVLTSTYNDKTEVGVLTSSFSWGLGRAAVCDCGTPWTFLLPFFFFLHIMMKEVGSTINQ